ncbi:MAG: SDR family NAD(P)-dependent oxidoreductase [Mycobacterium sp.]
MAPDNTAEDVVLVVDADTDQSYEYARALLDRGVRVVVTARTTGSLARILSNQSRNSVFAIAADLRDPWQRRRLCERVVAEFGQVTYVVDGHTGESKLCCGAMPLSEPPPDEADQTSPVAKSGTPEGGAWLVGAPMSR